MHILCSACMNILCRIVLCSDRILLAHAARRWETKVVFPATCDLCSKRIYDLRGKVCKLCKYAYATLSCFLRLQRSLCLCACSILLECTTLSARVFSSISSLLACSPPLSGVDRVLQFCCCCCCALDPLSSFLSLLLFLALAFGTELTPSCPAGFVSSLELRD